MVGCALALDLDQDPHVRKVSSDPLVEAKGERSWSVSDVVDTSTATALPSSGGALGRN